MVSVFQHVVVLASAGLVVQGLQPFFVVATLAVVFVCMVVFGHLRVVGDNCK